MSQASALLDWLHSQGVDFQIPELLWALLLVPVALLGYVAARRGRRRVAGAFDVMRAGMTRRPEVGRLWRLIALPLLLFGLAGLIVGFARPVVTRPTPDDHATVVFAVEASLTMRATDVNPTRFDAAKAAARAAMAAVPDRVQVAVVGYSKSAYILLAPTHDHGAAPVALARLRTAEDSATGDAISVALATVPPRSGEAGPPASGAGTQPATQPKVPAAIVLISSGDTTAGGSLADAAAAARAAGVPVYTVAVGPRGQTAPQAPFDPAAVQQIAQATGGRFVAAPTASEWKRIYQSIGSDVTVERKPQEVGHYVGSAAFAVVALAMALSLIGTRRLV